MRTIRRLYFYAVALISLEVVVWGLIGLLRSIFSSRLVNEKSSVLSHFNLIELEISTVALAKYSKPSGSLIVTFKVK